MEYQTVEKYIRKHHLLEPGQKVVVGVSGGADSLTLLDCMANLGYELIVAHFDHRLREQSGEEAEHVQAIADAYGLPAIVGQWDERSQTNEGVALEEAARIARYGFLAGVANEHSIRVIAVGHTADDQVETILMHLLRGAGSSGLRGMRPKTYLSEWGLGSTEGMRLIRPLLFTSRESTLKHCRQVGLSPVFDPSNQDPMFFRNRIRLELLPTLETYNPGIRQALLRTAELMQAEVDWLDQSTEAALRDVIAPAGESTVRLIAKEFRKHHLAVQRALIRRIVLGLDPGLRDIPFETIERTLAYIQQEPPTGNLQLLGDLEMIPFGMDSILRHQGFPIYLPGYPQVDARDRIKLPKKGTTQLGSHYALEVQWNPFSPQEAGSLERWMTERNSAWRVAMDGDSLDFPLQIRNRRPGDRFRPFGMQGKQKLSDFFINEHIPACLRDHWPLLVTASDQIAWVVGVRMAETHRVRGTTQNVVGIEFSEE